jgi:hypothetical protein
MDNLITLLINLSFGRGHLSSQITKLNSIPKTGKYNIVSIKI